MVQDVEDVIPTEPSVQDESEKLTGQEMLSEGTKSTISNVKSIPSVLGDLMTGSSVEEIIQENL